MEILTTRRGTCCATCALIVEVMMASKAEVNCRLFKYGLFVVVNCVFQLTDMTPRIS